MRYYEGEKNYFAAFCIIVVFIIYIAFALFKFEELSKIAIGIMLLGSIIPLVFFFISIRDSKEIRDLKSIITMANSVKLDGKIVEIKSVCVGGDEHRHYQYYAIVKVFNGNETVEFTTPEIAFGECKLNSNDVTVYYNNGKYFVSEFNIRINLISSNKFIKVLCIIDFAIVTILLVLIVIHKVPFNLTSYIITILMILGYIPFLIKSKKNFRE